MRVFITGGANGIGREAIRNLRERGHDIVAADIDDQSLAELPNEVDTWELDVRDEERVEEVVGQESFDVLVNNAGYAAWAAIEDVETDTMKRHFQTNVYGMVYTVRAALPMLRDRGGRIVNVSSLVSRLTAPYFGIYSSTKHAVKAITEELRMEVEDQGVDVVQVEPGPIRTGFNERGLDHLETHLPDTHYKEEYEEYLEIDDLGGGTPEQAGAVVADAVTDHRPWARYNVTTYAWLLPIIRTVLPRGVWDWFVQKL